MNTIQDAKDVKANKRHSCNFCGEPIYQGEVYLKSTHTYDNKIYDWKTHKHCAALAHNLNMYDDFDDGLTQDGFVESVSEKHFDLILAFFDEKDAQKYSDVIQQTRYVRFKDKLHFVIKHTK